MIVDEIPDAASAPPRQPFAWKHLLAIVLGTAMTIAVVCAIATLHGKQEASFSFDDSRTVPARA